MTTMRGFAKRMRKHADGVVDNSDAMIRTVVITAASSVAMGTPVDTGTARGNWRTNIGVAPPDAKHDPYAHGEGGSSGPANLAAVVAQTTEEMRVYVGDRKDVYISNSVPYIERLNAGWSDQAPAGFIQKAVQAAVNAVRKARLIK